MMLVVAMAGAAAAETRTLKFYNVHTKERAKIVYKKNGRYLSDGLKKVNWILRDWRRKEPTKMDPRLLDLVWAAYQKSGSRDYIHIISGYRSPATNSMLRRTRGGQAKKSQHMLGKALDFYLPDVSLRKLRDVGLKMQVGGVGYYPKSGSPFVHLDVGGVRHWPRMSRKQLMAVFPDGKSMHVPSDGKPLPRYKQAVAEYKKRGKSPGKIVVASTEKSSSSGKKTTLLSSLFGGGADEEEETSAQFESKPRRSAAPAKAVEAAPSKAPEPEPETVVASLPTRNIPIPAFAPRAAPAAVPMPVVEPQVQAAPQPLPGAQQAAPVPSADLPLPTVPRAPVPGAPVPPQAIPGAPVPAQDVPVAVQEPQQPVAVAALVPVPTLRPTNTPLANRLPDTDSAVLSALQARNDEVGTVPAAQALASAENSEAQASAIRAALAASSDESDVVTEPVIVAGLPVPTPRPGSAVGRPSATGIPVPAVARRGDQPKPTMVAALAKASPRQAILASGGNVETAIRSSVNTAPKQARPSARDAAAAMPKAHVVPIDADVRSWAIHGKDATGGKAGRLAEARREIRTAPTSVIAQGFVQDPQPDPRRFSGKAVSFLSVARFDVATN